VPATGIMRTLQVGDRPTRLAQAIAEFGRIDKTLHTLTYIDDEAKRRGTLTQLNRGEGRHSVARAVFHGKRGELRQHYREGQEDQLGALGLVLNMIVLWNTIYMEAALDQLRVSGYPVKNEDVARLSPLQHEHINMLGRYSFSVPEAVAKGELRPLRPSRIRLSVRGSLYTCSIVISFQRDGMSLKGDQTMLGTPTRIDHLRRRCCLNSA
jgi:hypothetical protein